MKTAILSVVACGVALTTGAYAQMHKVTNPDTVVRAVGVYEWTGDLAKPTGSRFVPVTVFIDGEIEDAGVYLPQPIPFALLTGNVYELEDAGLGKGTLVLETALKTTLPEGSPAPAYIEGWTAYGSYKAPAQERKSASKLKPSKTLPVISVSGGDPNKPHFSDKSADASRPTDQQKSANPSDDSAKKSDDTDRPTMKRRSDDTASTADDTNNAPSQTAPDPDDKAERPTLRRRSPEDIKNDKQKKRTDLATVTSAGSLNDDPDRPRLKHNTKSSDDDNDMPKLLGVPPDMKQMVAVSDAKNREPHPFARPWEDTAEHAAILAKMQGFARAKLAEYGVIPGVTPPQQLPSTATTGTKVAAGSSANAPAPNEGPGPPRLKRGIPTDDTTEGTPATAKPATQAGTEAGPPRLKRGIPTDDTTAAAARPAPSLAAKKASASSARSKTHHTTPVHAPVVLAGEELKGYLLSYGGAPTYVYMAHTVETGSVMRYVTVVAQDDGMGQLKVALASATDAAHLDRTPWMRLVDAVDVEASNRASLLFELRGQSSRQFALYRVIAAKPEEIFVTANGF
ncbi:MAG: hypothetical protein JSS95_10450 [Acidobacteria bacterium]|nr:hypothetical protein [Acidobacteriota bacterium]